MTRSNLRKRIIAERDELEALAQTATPKNAERLAAAALAYNSVIIWMNKRK